MHLQLTLKSLLFLIAAIIFGIAVLLAWAGDAYAVWHPRAFALAWCLAMIAWFLWAAGS